ncbi:MAG: hypothetical protein EP335_05820 [Alphaproteobacteria bacterium]|nr:MAG: hypothetical protein EP335_05820 [Alphaproteobacteria bacterium]
MAHVRARKVITRGPIRVVGKFPSLKSGRMLHWESQLERDRFRMLEFDPDVKSFREQPFSLQLEVDGETCRYTPDIEVIRRNRVVVEEVKPASRLSGYDALFEEAAKVLAGSGRHFEVHTDESMRQGAYIANITFLLPYRQLPIRQNDVDLVAAMVPADDQVPLGRVADALSSNAAPDWSLWVLLSRHVLAADYVQPLSRATSLRRSEGGEPCLL